MPARETCSIRPLFPIVYDRRVQGRPLSRLVYRWAAMNPPPDEELDEGGALYLGSEPLDAALADRFPYIMSVPDWDDLTPADQKKVLADQFAGRHEFPVAIRELVAEARKRYEELVPELTPRLTRRWFRPGGGHQRASYFRCPSCGEFFRE